MACACLAIEADPSLAFEYSARGNLVGVVTNGTAVLGLGDIGPLAGKPVMEGKGRLFQKFAGIDVFDIEVAEHDPDELVSGAGAAAILPRPDGGTRRFEMASSPPAGRITAAAPPASPRR